MEDPWDTFQKIFFFYLKLLHMSLAIFPWGELSNCEVLLTVLLNSSVNLTVVMLLQEDNHYKL
jgi:hypothetical protein